LRFSSATIFARYAKCAVHNDEARAKIAAATEASHIKQIERECVVDAGARDFVQRIRFFFARAKVDCTISRNGPARFRINGPPCMGYRRSRGLGVLCVLFLGGKFSGFDPSIGLAGDVDGERRVLESIADGGDDLVPVIDGQRGSKGDGLID
jgi:hypothetical protein